MFSLGNGTVADVPQSLGTSWSNSANLSSLGKFSKTAELFTLRADHQCLCLAASASH